MVFKHIDNNLNDTTEQFDKLLHIAITKEKMMTNNNEIVFVDDEINNIVDKIVEIIANLPDKNIILDKVNNLLDQYLQDRKILEPKYDDIDTISLSISTIDYRTLKPTLLAKLETILLGLSSKKKLIEFLSELNKYKREINNDNSNELIEKELSTLDIIKNILYISRILDISRRNKYLKRLNGYIDISIKQYQEELLKIEQNNIELSLNNTNAGC